MVFLLLLLCVLILPQQSSPFVVKKSWYVQVLANRNIAAFSSSNNKLKTKNRMVVRTVQSPRIHTTITFLNLSSNVDDNKDVFHRSNESFTPSNSVNIKATEQTPTTKHDNNKNTTVSNQHNFLATKFLEKASQLRKEVQVLEDESRRSQTRSEIANSVTPTITNISNSMWTITYRFSNEPETNNSKDENTKVPEKQQPERTFYSGQFTVLFRFDGYTDIIDAPQSRSTTSYLYNNLSPQTPSSTVSSSLQIIKAWGWDIERSREDDNEYVLFSIDTVIEPLSSFNKSSSTPTSGMFRQSHQQTQTQRFYFQTRYVQDIRTGGTITLQDGTVTIKQDVSSPMRWGLFSSNGILAQFKSVGNFVAKPSTVPQ